MITERFKWGKGSGYELTKRISESSEEMLSLSDDDDVDGLDFIFSMLPLRLEMSPSLFTFLLSNELEKLTCLLALRR